MPKKTQFDSRTYYIGTEDDDVLFLRKFIVKHSNAKSKHLSNRHELPRLERILEKIETTSTTQTDMNKQNEELRKIIADMDEKFLRVNSKEATAKINRGVQHLSNHNQSEPKGQTNRIDFQKSEVSPTPPNPNININNHRGIDPFAILIILVVFPMLIVYAFDITFWGSGVCMGIGWILSVLFALVAIFEPLM